MGAAMGAPGPDGRGDPGGVRPTIGGLGSGADGRNGSLKPAGNGCRGPAEITCPGRICGTGRTAGALGLPGVTMAAGGVAA
jgi:hypothetical protein